MFQMEYSAVRVIFTLGFLNPLNIHESLWQIGRYPQIGAKWAF
jgi:hypothetical protein